MSKEEPSPREKQVWLGIAKGRSKLFIAQELGISEKTVETQAVILYKKIGARSRADATRLAIQAGLLEIQPPAHKRNGFDGKTHEHDMAILLAELELQKAKTRAAEARVNELKLENRDLLRRIPKGN